MEKTKTHWKQLSNPDYIGAYAFQPGEEKTVTISTVGVETVSAFGERVEAVRVKKTCKNKIQILCNYPLTRYT